jgi:hypothetical protein
MKTLAFVLLISLSSQAIAQDSLFVRVYDLNGRKTHKGKISAVTDSSLTLKRGNAPTIFPVRDIGSIRTRRSAGHNMLLATTIGVVPLAILGAASANQNDSQNGFTIIQYNAGEGALGGALIGLAAGGLIGGISILCKNSIRFSIDGDPQKWKAFRSRIGR